MNNNLKVLLELLSDGVFHSGSNLGKNLCLTRGAIWKLIKQLNKYDIEIEAKTHLGYRIPGGLELLDKKIICNYIKSKYKDFSNNMIILDETASTNPYAKENNVNICLAESQSEGRGRLGKKWFSPYGKNIYLSLLYNFVKEPSELSGLSLAIAIAVASTLESYGIKKNISLKWPNDVLWQKRKIAGILIDVYGEANCSCQAVIGVGLNVKMKQKTYLEINQPWCDVAQIINDVPQRNKLAGLLINELLSAATEFQKNGLKSFLKKWKELDIAYGNKVTITTSQKQKISGIGQGVNDKGHFLLKDSSGKIQCFAAGEVSLKILYR